MLKTILNICADAKSNRIFSFGMTVLFQTFDLCVEIVHVVVPTCHYATWCVRQIEAVSDLMYHGTKCGRIVGPIPASENEKPKR